MATRFVFTPQAAEFPSANFPELTISNTTSRRPVLAFDPDTDETCHWTAVVPQGWTGTITAYIYYIMATATSGKVDFEVSVEAVTDADALDLDASTGWDTANTITAPTVPSTAGYMDVITCTLTNNDSSATGDYIRFRLVRDADDVTNDTAAGDCHVLAVEIRDGA